jgi:hypothetical protein
MNFDFIKANYDLLDTDRLGKKMPKKRAHAGLKKKRKR